MSKLVAEVSDSEFDAQVLAASGPVVVDFGAAWCPPCRAIAPSLEDLAHEYEGRVKVVKVDVDTSPRTAEKYRVRSLPTLLVLKNGAVVAQRVGAAPRSKLAELFDSALR